MQKINTQHFFTLHKKIAETDEKIMETREQLTSPKAQIITDMPRSRTVENAIERGIEKTMQLEEKRAYYYDCLVSEWLIIEEIFNECNISTTYIELMKNRYLYGLKWKDCAKAMKKVYPKEKWNENKVFRIYRHIVEICTKNGYIIC